MRASTEVGAVLARESLHAALADPALEAINFLNEVIDRHPTAISFAPGAPFAELLPDLDLGSRFDRYIAHLREARGFDDARIRRHLYQYGPSRGLINDLLAESLRRDEGIEVDPDDLVVTAGCQEALLLVLRALCRDASDVIAVVNPCFAGIAGAARLLNVPLLPVQECGDDLDWEQLETALRAEREAGRRVRGLYVAPDFSNPSGAVLGLEARRRLLALAQREDLLLLEDNAYAFTAADGSGIPSLKSLDSDRRVVYLNTCAKICLPGARVGFVVADQIVVDAAGRRSRLADELATLKSMVTVNTSPIAQAFVGALLLEAGGSLAELARDKAARYRSNLRHLLGALERELTPQPGEVRRVSWNRPAGGFFVSMKLPVAADADLLAHCAAVHGVLWTPMRFFHIDGGGAQALRLSCSYLTHEQIDVGVRRLAGFLRDQRVGGFAPAQALEGVVS